MLDLPHAACRPRSAPDMRSRMRSPSHAPSFCFVKPVWLPRNPTSCPNTAKAPCVCTLPARSEAWNRPSRARFRPAAAAGAARRHPGAAQPRLRGPVTPPARTRVAVPSPGPACCTPRSAEDGPREPSCRALPLCFRGLPYIVKVTFLEGSRT